MVTTQNPNPNVHDATASAAERERELVAWAAEIGARISRFAADHDRDGTFVTEAYDILRDEGYLALAVPAELGGHGATVRQVSMAQRELARHCSATALASVMHHHVVLFTAWRYRRGMAGAEATLRAIADDGIVVVSTGGADQTRPRGTAVRVDGGYRVSGRKVFASQSPVGAVMATMFPYEDPDEGTVVLNMSIPMADDGVTVLDNWDTLGMRGTGSHDVTLEDVFVPDARVIARRPHATIDPPLQVVLSVAMAPVAAVYLGVARSARDHAVATVAGTDRAADPVVQRQIGLMDTRLRVAGWALDGALATVGDDPAPSMDTVVEVMAAKREIALAGAEVCDLALEVAGGRGFYRSSPIERCVRDIRGAKFHPFTPEQSLVHAGLVALGLPADQA
ncbi:MAG: acyl-CoA dehydrogenase family protein [Actinomycetota bacterium]|nr:acyl-CoA dehydrogenase family protein [Actinomycetota bacterium]